MFFEKNNLTSFDRKETLTTRQTIPKVIHYCWFGHGPKSDLINSCIESWKKYCPDWEIHEWNEENWNVSKYNFSREAYEQKKWAFVSDVARLDIIFEMGGVYLDTDVILHSPLESLITNKAFFAFENMTSVSTGQIFGAVSGHRAVEMMLQEYCDLKFITNGKMNLITCPDLNTEALKKFDRKFQPNGNTQNIKGTLILSLQDYAKVAEHLYTKTWIDGPKYKKRKFFKYTWLKTKLRKYHYFQWAEKLGGRRGLTIYKFISYDLLDCGIIYFIKRFIYKIKNNKILKCLI